MKKNIWSVVILSVITICFSPLYAQQADSVINHDLFIGLSTPMFYGIGLEIQYKFDAHWGIGGDVYYIGIEPDGDEDHKDYEGYIYRGYVIYDFIKVPKKFSPFGIAGFAYGKETYTYIIDDPIDEPYEEKVDDDEKFLTLGVGGRLKIVSKLYLDGEIAVAISDSWLGTDVDPWFRLGIEMGF